ncbi:DUF2244 domain-containing protein [Devosia nitrariae]|uniref:Membrane protein n=1 Tax=Devosia nitrariae TaxID=2071872 RepID=A0ABQ5WDZ3_9HYPH|nr:DUF2244 domain-containing protein [Devosia nitrariae]GLQ58182.1 membrane protein [Devosia nitrariae]
MQPTSAPLFAAVLTPHRSMSPKGIAVVTGLVLVLVALPGLMLLSIGAWPVIGFMGIDVLAIAAALWLSLRQAKRREEVTVWPGRLEIVSITPKGDVAKANFKPTAVRLVIERDYDERTTGLKLKSAGADTEIGAFLTADEKASFSKALGTALRRARAESVTSKPGRQH